jgi:hypothetical protein
VSRNIPRRALGAMIDTRWAIAPEQLDIMIAIANREDIGALARDRGEYKHDDTTDAGLCGRRRGHGLAGRI